jgi:hypothetical protein
MAKQKPNLEADNKALAEKLNATEAELAHAALEMRDLLDNQALDAFRVARRGTRGKPASASCTGKCAA